jgi:hypothetical protein
MTNKAKFLVSMKMLSDYFRQPLSETAVEGYWIALGDVSDEQMNTAVTRALRESRFLPTGSELIAFAGCAPPSKSAQAILCWEKVRRAIDTHDYLVASIDFGPRVNQVIALLGGWDALCRASLPELDNPGWLQKRFLKAYEELADLPVESLRGAPLAGSLPPKWKDPVDHVIRIEGEPESKALPPVNQQMKELLEGLAEAKS